MMWLSGVMSFKMYVAAHKASVFPEDLGYVPIQVGKALTDLDLGIQGDNTEDNISGKNHTFCEWTAIYWIMKNCSADFVGLSHYRRYFASKEKSVSFEGFDIAASDDFPELEGGIDLVVSEPFGFFNDLTKTQISVEEQYFGTAIGFDLHLAREALRRLQPSYLNAFDFVMRNCQIIPFNMMVGKQAVFKECCRWMFPLLFMLEEWIPWQTYNEYQRRAIGFLAERLHTVWIVENRSRYRIAHRPVIFCG
jgi:hypothetical protein